MYKIGIFNFIYVIAYRDVQRLTVDVIATNVFSYKSDIFNHNDDAFLKNLQRVFLNLDMGTADLRVKIENFIASKY